MSTPADPYENVEKPPLKWLLAYRALGMRLPPQYRPWVAKDVTSKWFLTRRIARSIGWAVAFLALYYVAQSAIYEPPGYKPGSRLFQAFLILVALSLLASGATLVRRTLRWQRVDRHGRLVRPKPKSLAILDNQHVVLLGAIALVAFTGASAVYANSVVVPDGPLGAKCRKPKTETVERIRSGLKDPATKFENLREVKFGDSSIVAATVDKPGTVEKAGIWIVSPGQVYELALPEQSVTTFGKPENVDRLGSEALQRAAKCLSEVMRK